MLGYWNGEGDERGAVLYNKACEELFRVKSTVDIVADEQVKTLVVFQRDDWWFIPAEGKVTVRIFDLEARQERTFGIDFSPLIQQMKERR